MLKPVSRRSFIKASAATAAAVSLTSFDMHSWMASASADEKAAISKIPTTCNGCSSQCGMIAYTKNGRLWKLEGHPDHPRSKGTLCARGHGYATLVYSKERLEQPMKRMENGKYEPISWEQAYKEIGDKLKEIIKEHGPESVALVQDPRPTGNVYATRFIKALGSPNYYTHHVACNNSRDTGFNHTIGGVPSADIANSSYIMFIGRSYGDGIRPSSMSALAQAKENGAKVIIVDPRKNNTSPFADQWLPIRPGTDLALVLAMAHILIEKDLYDAGFIEDHATGFEEFKKEVKQYTPEWAEKVTGIDAQTIKTIATDMAQLKPKAVIEQSWRGAFGCNYKNSTETGRAVALFNAMLGNIQQEGGYIFGASAGLGDLDPDQFPAPQEPDAVKDGEEDFPLAPRGRGVANIVPLRAKEGKMKAAFYHHSNAALGYGNPEYYKEALNEMDLVVTIDVQMSETALLSHYVLPEPSYMERDDAVDGVGGGTAAVVLRQKAVDRVHPNTKPADEIFTELAKASGVGEYFTFTLEDYNKAAVEPLGITMDELREKGSIPLEDKKAEIGTVPEFNTPSGKVEFASQTFEDAGFNAVPTWIPPLVEPKNGSYRLTTGKQAIHSHTQTANIPMLMQITKDYDLERLWMNRQEAKKKGIQDSDLVEVSSDSASSTVKVKLTDRLHPETVYIPSHYGITSKYLTTAKGVGFSYMEHVPFHFQPMSGCSMIHEVIVDVRKVDA